MGSGGAAARGESSRLDFKFAQYRIPKWLDFSSKGGILISFPLGNVCFRIETVANMLKESELQVLSYLTLDPEGAGFVSQIGRDIGMSKGEVSKAIKVLKQNGLVSSELRGRNMICSIDRRSPIISKLRGAFNLLEIMPQIEVLRACTDKVVLFGSCAQGTDTRDSDIDLFVITRDKVKANKVVQKVKLSRPVQWVIKTPQEYVVLNSKEPVFAKELGRGIVLWEAYETARV